MEVETAASAEAALKLMRAAVPEYPFEAALIDVQMPEVDGIELARMIKSDPALATSAVILVSSVGTAHDYRSRLRALDVDGWLTKPVPQSSLYNALLKVLPCRAEVSAQARLAGRVDTSVRPPTAELKLLAGRKLRVLLAEDNPINQKLAKFQLKKLGAEVDCVSNGREAVDAVMRIPYDAVLMDCQMPEMDGYEATKEIRQREGSQHHTQIVALTAHALAGDRETCLAAGMDAYISKPVKPEILEGVLAQIVAPDAASTRVTETASVESRVATDASDATSTSKLREDNPAQALDALNGHAAT